MKERESSTSARGSQITVTRERLPVANRCTRRAVQPIRETALSPASSALNPKPPNNLLLLLQKATDVQELYWTYIYTRMFLILIFGGFRLTLAPTNVFQRYLVVGGSSIQIQGSSYIDMVRETDLCVLQAVCFNICAVHLIKSTNSSQNTTIQFRKWNTWSTFIKY